MNIYKFMKGMEYRDYIATHYNTYTKENFPYKNEYRVSDFFDYIFGNILYYFIKSIIYLDDKISKFFNRVIAKNGKDNHKH